MKVDNTTGCFEITGDTYLQPEEAIRLGRFLVEFYTEETDDT